MPFRCGSAACIQYRHEELIERAGAMEAGHPRGRATAASLSLPDNSRGGSSETSSGRRAAATASRLRRPIRHTGAREGFRPAVLHLLSSRR